MNKGDEVTIKDGSRMITVNQETGKLDHYGNSHSTKTIGHCRDKFIILDMDGNYPAEQLFPNEPRKNDTMLFNTKTQEIWFCTADISLVPLEKENLIIEHNGIEYSESTLRSILDKFTK